MNKKPLLLRTLIVLGVIAVFVVSMYPLTQRDFYETFTSILKDKDDSAGADLIAKAKALELENPDIYASQALLAAADSSGVDMTQMVDGADLADNRDVVGLVRKKASSSIRLGLDLNGGVEFVLELVPDQEFLARFDEGDESSEEIKRDMTREFDRYRDIAIEILRQRLESQKIFEAEIAPMGKDYVALRAPIVAKDEKLKLMNIISMSAKLRFRLVHENNDALINDYLTDPANFTVPVGYELMENVEYRKGTPTVHHFIVENKWLMDGRGIATAFPSRGKYGQREILIRFNREGTERFGQITSDNVGRMLAIVLDDKLYCAANINEPIPGGNAQITGSFTDEECKLIADALVSGGFPFQIKINAVFDTDPKLGASNVANGIWVGIISLAVMAVFMIGYYLRAGLIAIIALTVNVVLLLGALAAFDATLTLPGIAGIILTIGMAVDANVLIFERIREELNAGKKLTVAIEQGFGRAFSAVFDANLTTLITGIILLSIGTGAVKGFAVTLCIGILSSLFTGVFMSRLLFDCGERYFNFKTLKMLQIFKNTNFNFIKSWKWTAGASLAFILLSIGVFIYTGKDMLGVDFTGGTTIVYNYDSISSPGEIESALAENGYAAVVTLKSSAIGSNEKKLEILIRDVEDGDSKMESVASIINAKFPNANLVGDQEMTVGGLIGMEFSKSALWAIFWALIGIGLYITIRYEFAYATAAILTLLHDVLVVMGIFIMTGREISLTVVAAVLTVIGYSVNDTVVIFDRVRENLKLHPDKGYFELINDSLNQTLSRTMITSVSTFIVVFIMYLWGGVAINDFIFVMMWGVIVGTYSSIFIASAIAGWFHRNENRHYDQKTAKKKSSKDKIAAPVNAE